MDGWGRWMREHKPWAKVRVPVVAQWLTNPTRNMRLWVRFLASLSGLRILRIQRCRELWYRLQMGLGSGSGIAVAVV